MNMKLSYRDKVIFMVVVVVAILLFGFFFFVRAKIQESQDMKDNLTAKETERDEVDAKIDTLTSLEEQLKSDIKEVDDLQKDFIEEQETFQADQYLYELLEPTGVRFSSMSLTGETEGELSPYFYLRNCVAYDLKINADIAGDSLPQEVYDRYYGTEPEGDAAVVVALDEVSITMNVEIDEDGTPDWDPIYQVMDVISNHDKTIYLKSFESADSYGGDEELNISPYASFSIVVDVFSIEHMDTSLAQ